MIPVTTRSDQHLAVFGLGASGRAAAHALIAGGARVSAWDDNEKSREAAAAERIPLADPATADWADISALVLSPGIPLTHPAPHPVVAQANAAHRPVIGDIELLREACPEALLIGITGTNGKSTTSALIHHILQVCGEPVQLGGNFGPPVLGLSPPAPGETVVLELSSYQLDLTHDATFEIAVLLNLTPDHLDRHGDMDGYLAAKKRIFRTAEPANRQVAIIGVDDDWCRSVYEEIDKDPAWRAIPVSVGTSATAEAKRGVCVVDGRLSDFTAGNTPDTCDISEIPTLRGAHNWQNAAVAWAVARARGLAPVHIAAALRSFPGLPHRMETIAEIGGVLYVNDSKATNGEAVSRALACYDDVYLIAGGVAKQDGLKATVPFFDRIRHVFLIGAAADDFEAEIAGRLPVTQCGDLPRAVAEAHRTAPPGGVVLLSPACASFDQYPNFAARGEHFRDLVRALGKGDAA